MKSKSINVLWNEIIEKYNVLEKLKEKDLFKISSDQIKEFKEPRLMVKWDCKNSLPEVLSKNKLNILPISRREYALGYFDIYKNFPDEKFNLKHNEIELIETPFYETLDITNITSEKVALNVLLNSKVIEKFLETSDEFARTFEGRMGTGEFEFIIDNINDKNQIAINVDKSQCEVDAGLENESTVVIIEAKNVLNDSFNVRQLYYPYRTWKDKINKNIRLVYALFNNDIYWLFEYKFKDPQNMSSAYLVNQKQYTYIEDTISISEIEALLNNSTVIDSNRNEKTPFIQADSFNKIISMGEQIYNNNNNGITKKEFSKIMKFDKRQSDYYYNAGKYLNIFSLNEGKRIVLTETGYKIFSKVFKQKNLLLVEQIIKNKIFHDLAIKSIEDSEIPSKSEIKEYMIRNNIISSDTSHKTIYRRAGTVRSWLNWIFYLCSE